MDRGYDWKRWLLAAATVMALAAVAGCPGKRDPTWRARQDEGLPATAEHPDVVAAKRQWERSHTVGARVAVGQAYLDHGEPLKAYGEFQAALGMDRDNVGALLGMGRLYTDLGSYDLAAKEYEAALEREPDNEMALNSLGFVSFAQGRLDQAAKQFERVIEINPHNVAPRLALGTTYLRAQKIDQAVRTYRAALAVAPDSSKLHVNYGHALEIKGQVTEAKDQYREALRLDPHDDGAKNNLAFALASQDEDLPEALRLASEAVASQPDVASFRDTRGWVLFRMGRNYDALAELQTAASMWSASPAVHYHLGVVYQKVERFEEAIHELQMGRQDLRFQEDADRRIREMQPHVHPSI
jgi:tetratricopeptide (TPR) repeat protein